MTERLAQVTEALERRRAGFPWGYETETAIVEAAMSAVRASRAGTGSSADRALLIATTRALDLLANVKAGSADERRIWEREVQPALDAAREHLMAPPGSSAERAAGDGYIDPNDVPYEPGETVMNLYDGARAKGFREGIEAAACWCAKQSAFGVMFAEGIRRLAPPIAERADPGDLDLDTVGMYAPAEKIHPLVPGPDPRGAVVEAARALVEHWDDEAMPMSEWDARSAATEQRIRAALRSLSSPGATGAETAPTHWGPRFDAGQRCLRHGEHACPSCLAYALVDATCTWYEADGSVTMLPPEDVTRRRKLAAKVIGAAKGLAENNGIVRDDGRFIEVRVCREHWDAMRRALSGDETRAPSRETGDGETP